MAKYEPKTDQWMEEAEQIDPPRTQTQPDGFDVYIERSIGRVEFSNTGKFSPYESAMLLIAKNDEPGIYTFPFPASGEVRVTVEYPANWKA